jgi:hypothetical protein
MMIEVGKEMIWRKVVSNYGHVGHYRVIVRKVGKRITIEAPLKAGGTKLVAVKPESLRDV